MMVTRDVIYDLLPAYFADEVSPDTRTLVDEFLKDDPEFAQMMERFRKIMEDREAGQASSAFAEKKAFDRARAINQKESELKGYIVAFTLAALFVPAVIMLSGRPFRAPFWVMAMAFLFTAGVSWLQLYYLRRDAGRRSNL